jgi:integrase/recombinase XerD
MSPQDIPDIARAHISSETTLIPAINAWKYYLEDQGSSPNTIKAFVGDLNLLASYLPPDRTLGSITTTDLNNLFFAGFMNMASS